MILILNRLIDGKPLTPIEDTPDIWNAIIDRRYLDKILPSNGKLG